MKYTVYTTYVTQTDDLEALEESMDLGQSEVYLPSLGTHATHYEFTYEENG